MTDEEEMEDFLLRQYRLVDAYWFLEVERKFGLDAAVELNENVWGILGAKTAREIKRRFQIDKKGLEGFIQAMRFFPWTKITPYVINKEKDKVVITVPNCPPQAARIREGLGEFPCKKMHIADFSGFAREIDERIEVMCIHAPPDPHQMNCFCRWEFSIKK
jgi:hypothetical protein